MVSCNRKTRFMLSAGCQGDWLTLEEFSHIVHSNMMMSSRGGKLKEEREGGMEGYWFWIKRKSATLLTRTHTHKAWQNGKVKKEAVYTFTVLDGIFSLIFRSTFTWLFEASVLGTGPGQHYPLQQWKIQYELSIRYHLLGLGLGNSNYPNVNLRQEPLALWMDEWF